MMQGFPFLSALLTLPLCGVLLLFLIRSDSEQEQENAKLLALWTSLLTFVLSLVMWYEFIPSQVGYQFKEFHQWIPGMNLNYHLGIDGLSIYFVLLSTLLTPICILASWRSVKIRVRSYMMAFLALETFMIGTFCALDLFLFYVFFEGVLIPMFFIIAIWGGKDRLYAAFKFFLYTFIGSVLMLVSFVIIYYQAGSADITVLPNHLVNVDLQKWLWWALFIGFAVKVPMFPVHTWLPDAHVQAPTAGSVILAGVLLKMGGYGFIRFLLPLCPDACHYFAPVVVVLSLIAIIYAALVALVQTDMKKLIAYSSISHMGFVTLGIFSFDTQSMDGAIFQMISHGIVSSALFLCVGVVYDRFHTREIAFYGGLAKVMPVYATVFLILTLASAGLPGTSGFIGEFLVLLGSFKAYHMWVFFAAIGMIFSAAYGLWLYRRIIFEKIVNEDLKEAEDLTLNEKSVLGLLCIITIVAGIYPNWILSSLSPYSRQFMIDYKGVKDIQLPQA